MTFSDTNNTTLPSGIAVNDPLARDASRERWQADRMTGIGGSDSAAALGESPFRKVWDVWAEKTGLVEPQDLSDKLYVRLGQVMERGVGEIYAEQSGRVVSFWPQSSIMRHPTIPWLFCTPDAFQAAAANDESQGTLSIKTTDQRFLKDWETNGIPLYYQIQAQHELAVTGLTWGTVAVAFGRRTLKWYDFVRHDRFIDGLISRLAEFWKLVETKTPPPPDWSEECSKVLFMLHKKDNGQTVDLPAEFDAFDGELVSIKAQIEELEQRKRMYENELRAAIGDATYGRLPNGARYSWKHQSVKEYTVAASEKRVLRRGK